MKKIFAKRLYIALFGVCMVLGSCDDFFDINDDPNNPSPDKADVGLLLPAAQGAIISAVTTDLRSISSLLMRYTYDQFVTRYDISTNTAVTSWDDIYLGALPDLNLLIETAEEQEFKGFAGIGKVLKAYIYSVTVDMFGEAPFNEGTKFTDNLSPKFDDGLTVYKGVFELLDDGIADLSDTEATMPESTMDFIYGGNREQWLKAAYSIKMKLLIQVKDVTDSEIQQRISTELPDILQNERYITDSGDDFDFHFGTSNNPENRHPMFVEDYTGDAGYKQLFFVNYMLDNDDPRLHYYLVRQTTTDPSGSAMPCNARDCNNLYQGGGWIARDHGDSDGVPSDGKARVAFGVYPAGGKYVPADASVAPTAENQGLQGAGVFPILPAYYLKFLAAEAALTIPGAGGDARALFEEAVRQNIATVIAFGMNAPGYADFASYHPTQADIDTYVGVIMALYDAAGTDDERLDIVMFELWKAMFANPMEAYNSYRRTGFPSILQTDAASLDEVNQFTLRALYSIKEIASNTSLTGIPHSRVPVFWDVNPDDTNDQF
jgi:hypothetical protein